MPILPLIVGATVILGFLVLRARKKPASDNTNKQDPWEMNDRILGVQEWLEKTSLIPIFIATVSAMAFRGLFTYALGAVGVKDVPDEVLKPINFVVGLAVAGLVETLATMAGRKWWVGQDKVLLLAEQAAEQTAMLKIRKPVKDAQGNTVRNADGRVVYEEVDNPRALKAANVVKKRQERQTFLNKANFIFMLVGQFTSFIAAMKYAWDVANLGKHVVYDASFFMGLILDGLVTILILAGVFYIGVIYEPSKTDPDELVATSRKRLRYHVMEEKYERIKEGTQDNADIRYLMRGANAQEKAELEAMMTIDRSQEIWTVAQILEWLGWSASKRRDVTRKIKAAFDKSRDGVQHDPADPRKWIVTLPMVVELFQKDFVESRAKLEAAALAGQASATQQGGGYRQGGLPRHSSADHRQGSAPSGAAGGDTQGGVVVDGTVSDPAIDLAVEMRDLEERAKHLQEQLELVENSIRLELERDPFQDLQGLADRFHLPVAHIRLLQQDLMQSHQLTEPSRTGEAA